MLKEYKMDLHIHTCLSPCAELEMLPTRIVQQAVAVGLDCIGICDHNSAENAVAVRNAGKKQDVQVLVGMEICSSEEVHILSLFEDERALLKMQEIVHEYLPGQNNEAYFGEQLIVDENDELIDLTNKLLIGSTNLNVTQIVELIDELGGIAIASHIDRESFSIIGQLGFIPSQLPLDGVEVSWRCTPAQIADYKKYGLPIVQSSDAHILDDIGKVRTTFLLESPSFSEVAKAFRGIEGRTVNV
jgi:PHP family Zn ribbon phosphoesterase